MPSRKLWKCGYGKVYPGIALQAVMLTAGTLLLMVFLYANRIIRVTDRLRSGVIMATAPSACSTSSR